MRRFGLIGYPLAQSFSKQYFEEKFQREHIDDATFDLFSLARIEDFGPLLQTHQDLHGLAVTIPYKTAVIPYLQVLNEEAAKIGAINCIQFTAQGLKGFNTDILGFEQSFCKFLKAEHKRALVLGNGGASLAVQYVLRKLKMPFVTVVRKQGVGDICFDELTPKIIAQHPVIINCTPLGMYPANDSFPPIPYDGITANHYLYDLVYKPELTMFLQKGKEQGAIIQNGFTMLLIQAEENWKRWNEKC